MFEYLNDTFTTHSNDYAVTDATKGYGFYPKSVLNTGEKEIMRLIKLCN